VKPFKILRSIPFPGHTETWVICLARNPLWFWPKTIDCRKSQAFFESHFYSRHREGKYIYISVPAPSHPWAEINPENGQRLDPMFSVYIGHASVDIEKLIPSLAGKQFVYCEQYFLADPQSETGRRIQTTALGQVANHMLKAGEAFNYLQNHTNKLLEKAFKG